MIEAANKNKRSLGYWNSQKQTNSWRCNSDLAKPPAFSPADSNTPALVAIKQVVFLTDNINWHKIRLFYLLI